MLHFSLSLHVFYLTCSTVHHRQMYLLLICFFPSYKQEADESLNFEEQILEAAKSIAAATSALVKAASAAQRELVAQGKVRHPTEKLSTKPSDENAGSYLLLIK